MRGCVLEWEAKLRPFVARRVRAPADVDDVLQDIYLRMQRGLRGLRDAERFGPWLFRVARSAIVDHQRLAAQQPRASQSEPDELAIRPAEDDENPVEQELVRHVPAFVAALPSPYREALTLTDLQGFSQKAAATVLRVPVSTMKSRVQRGRLRLRQLFDACCQISLDARRRVVACEPRADRPIQCQCRGAATGY
jgi:RNA polymerase sigma-70 factor, ECF subfamily